MNSALANSGDQLISWVSFSRPLTRHDSAKRAPSCLSPENPAPSGCGERRGSAPGRQPATHAGSESLLDAIDTAAAFDEPRRRSSIPLRAPSRGTPRRRPDIPRTGRGPGGPGRLFLVFTSAPVGHTATNHLSQWKQGRKAEMVCIFPSIFFGPIVISSRHPGAVLVFHLAMHLAGLAADAALRVVSNHVVPPIELPLKRSARNRWPENPPCPPFLKGGNKEKAIAPHLKIRQPSNFLLLWQRGTEGEFQSFLQP